MKALAVLAALVVGVCGVRPAPAAGGFKPALPGYRFGFPRDHASHDEYKTEWWYYTGHLRSPAGREFGFELTFFRSGVRLEDGVKDSPWSLENVYLAHFAITDMGAGRFFFDDRIGRAAMGSAGADGKRYHVWNGDWSASLEGANHRLRARTREYEIDLLLSSRKPPVIHGKEGISRKASCRTCASHYYSLTRLAASGSLRSGKKVLPVSGQAWMDHEFGSNQLTEEQIGWDWFSIQLDDGSDLMLYRMRRADGGDDPYSSGTVVAPDGAFRHLVRDGYSIEALARWTSPATRAVYPMRWRVVVPSEALELEILPFLESQELVTDRTTRVVYWEGACKVRGRRKGQQVTGRAYAELTGYDRDFRQRL